MKTDENEAPTPVATPAPAAAPVNGADHPAPAPVVEQQAVHYARKIQIGPRVFYEDQLVMVELLASGEAVVLTTAGEFRFTGQDAQDIERFWSIPAPVPEKKGKHHR